MIKNTIQALAAKAGIKSGVEHNYIAVLDTNTCSDIITSSFTESRRPDIGG
jgi:hypothetical protein